MSEYWISLNVHIQRTRFQVGLLKVGEPTITNISIIASVQLAIVLDIVQDYLLSLLLRKFLVSLLVDEGVFELFRGLSELARDQDELFKIIQLVEPRKKELHLLGVVRQPGKNSVGLHVSSLELRSANPVKEYCVLQLDEDH